MLIVIKDNFVLATHRDEYEQEITLDTYPNADEILFVPDSYRHSDGSKILPGDLDLRLPSRDPKLFPQDAKRRALTADDLAWGEEMLKRYQGRLYSRPITASDNDLTKTKLKKVLELKQEMRIPLSWEIGDTGDNVADAVRTIVMARCIENGSVTDSSVIARFDAYCNSLLTAYGGAEDNMSVLELAGARLLAHLGERYYPAKSQVEAAQTIEEVEAVNLPSLE
jgi:hypothetical protein